mmetsp:Transcript_57045/g.150098  ORF Transcript_57045/g.150098 Transcript_57045/m.150098 type:complete len:228 (+) Transcript_57045:477-1160(+)
MTWSSSRSACRCSARCRCGSTWTGGGRRHAPASRPASSPGGTRPRCGSCGGFPSGNLRRRARSRRARTVWCWAPDWSTQGWGRGWPRCCPSAWDSGSPGSSRSPGCSGPPWARHPPALPACGSAATWCLCPCRAAWGRSAASPRPSRACSGRPSGARAPRTRASRRSACRTRSSRPSRCRAGRAGSRRASWARRPRRRPGSSRTGRRTAGRCRTSSRSQGCMAVCRP